MDKIIQDLEARVATAKKRLDETTQTFQAAQQAHQAAQHLHNVWSLALAAEIRDEQQRASAATEKQYPLPNVAPAVSPASHESLDASEGVTKTDIVRTLLGQHTNGMSASEIWQEVHGQFKYRPYLYSVLKRLRDREEIVQKRNKKYCLKTIPKMEDTKEQAAVVQ